MICQNCSYILSGSEDFCPHCGTACKKHTVPPNRQEQEAEIPIPQIKTPPKTSIFETGEVYSHSQEKQVKQEPKKSSSKAASGMFLMLFLVVLCIGAVIAMDYLGIVPAVSFGKIMRPDATTVSQEDITSSQDTDGSDEFSDTKGIVYPEINYKPSSIYINSQNGAAMKKGPNENFAQICILPYAEELQVLGTSSAHSQWVYVYAVDYDLYGWVNAGYVSERAEAEEISNE